MYPGSRFELVHQSSGTGEKPEDERRYLSSAFAPRERSVGEEEHAERERAGGDERQAGARAI